MDAVGLHGGPTRPPRLPLDDQQRAVLDAARGRAARRRHGLIAPPMRAARTFSAIDSHTEGMPTRVITGGVDAAAGHDDARAQAVVRGATATSCASC